MNIHEFQAKEIFQEYGIPVPRGCVADTPSQAWLVAEDMGITCVLKAQVHSGGRGKAGGIRIAQSKDEVMRLAEEMIGTHLVTRQTGPEGKLVRRVLVEETVPISRELYLGITVDRSRKAIVVMASSRGGMEIEETAGTVPQAIQYESVDPRTGLQDFQARKLAYSLGLEDSSVRLMSKIVKSLYQIFIEYDCSLVEINPLVITQNSELLALDAKLVLDDNALFRHRDLQRLRDFSQENSVEIKAAALGFSYIKMDGNIGCMVNGAGLAMTTLDMIKLHGGSAANFLDVGGGPTAEGATNAFRLILGDPAAKGIFVNIFGGISRCDVMAQGIVEALKKTDTQIPLVVRLQGTFADEGRQILENSGLNIVFKEGFEEAALTIVELVRKEDPK
ncbi:MAG: ADP-forming succinate--CoA ligase subunit beta [Deltaproteobacteria bacterium]|nr:ADP-forming succinate--CoA ligase subunit beta [Deltaproteobacteria bacterium]